MATKELNSNDVLEDDSNDVEMSFLDHLEELRWRIIYALIGVVAGTIICWIFIDFLVNVVLLRPAQNAGATLQNLRPFGQIFLYFEVAMIGGVVLSIPNIFYQFWKFIAPALRKNEKKYILSIVIFSTVCFLAGIVFAYFSLLPYTMKFATQFGTTQIKNEFAIDEYLSIIISVMLGAGIIFELPMVSYFLTRLGILTPAFMKKYRRYAIVLIFIAAAFLTPPDPVSQVVLAVPLVLLYELSIFISKLALKKR